MMESAPVGMRFSLLHRAIKKQLDEAIRDEDLTGVQLFVLSALQRLEETPGAELRQKDLEQVSRVTHPTMTAILNRLEKKGYVRCTRSPLDRRAKCVASTEKARGLQRRMLEADEAAFRSLCAGLDDVQTAALLAITERMAANACAILKKGSENGCDQNACREPAGQ